MTTKLICPSCKANRDFQIIDHSSYKCETCDNTFKQCKSAECSNLISSGFVCKKCLGRGIKSGSRTAIPALFLGGGALLLRRLRK